jgi:hypothetical protein
VLTKRFYLNLKVFLVLTLVIGGCFLFLNETLATEPSLSDPDALKSVAEKTESSWWDKVTNPFLSGFLWILYWILKFTLLLLSMAMWLLNVMISPEMFEAVFFSDTAKEGINTAWSFVRDFFNLFFILIIVLVGLSVILGVGKFKDKTILFRVALAAMLINFSKPITLFVIDVSQVFMNFFATSISKINYASKIQKLVSLERIFTFHSFSDNGAFVVVILFAIIMTLIMAIMLFYLAVSLIIRMIAFWVLIILSPLAMFGIAMEGTKLGSLKDDWFQNLVKWSFYGPILLFFILLSLVLASAISKSIAGLDGFSTMSPETLRTSAGGLDGFVIKVCGMLIPFITAIYLLFYGYDKAMKTSTGMAASILAAGNKKISDVGNRAKKIGLGAGRAMTFPGYRTAAKETIKSGLEDYDGRGRFITRKLTKKGREDRQAELNAKTKNFFGDGDALRDYEQGKAQEITKKWKDNPPSDDELKTAFESKDSAKKIAATLYKSQNNKIGSAEEYEQAMKNLEGHNGLKEKVEREIKKENANAIIANKVKNLNPNDPNHGVNVQNVYKEIIKNKNNQEIFKNQNKEFYLNEDGTLKQEALEYLNSRSQGMKQNARRKMADPGMFKDMEVYRALANDRRGQFILGLRA